MATKDKKFLRGALIALVADREGEHAEQRQLLGEKTRSKMSERCGVNRFQQRAQTWSYDFCDETRCLTTKIIGPRRCTLLKLVIFQTLPLAAAHPTATYEKARGGEHKCACVRRVVDTTCDLRKPADKQASIAFHAEAKAFGCSTSPPSPPPSSSSQPILMSLGLSK